MGDQRENLSPESMQYFQVAGFLKENLIFLEIIMGAHHVDHKNLSDHFAIALLGATACQFDDVGLRIPSGGQRRSLTWPAEKTRSQNDFTSSFLSAVWSISVSHIFSHKPAGR